MDRTRTKPHWTGHTYLSHSEYVDWLRQSADRWSAIDKNQENRVRERLRNVPDEDCCEVCIHFNRRITK